MEAEPKLFVHCFTGIMTRWGIHSIKECTMTKSYHYSIITIMALLSGCQVINLKESNLSNALKSKNESILTDGTLSHQTQNLLYLVKKRRKILSAKF